MRVLAFRKDEYVNLGRERLLLCGSDAVMYIVHTAR